MTDKKVKISITNWEWLTNQSTKETIQSGRNVPIIEIVERAILNEKQRLDKERSKK